MFRMGTRTGRKGPDPRPVEARFWEKTRITPAPRDLDLDGPCVLWTAATQRGGYGKFSLGREQGTVIAHRFAWWLLTGEWPDLQLDHLCRRVTCVAVAHLEPVTPKVNVDRAAATITHCPRNHPYDAENTRITATGSRKCRTCHRDRARERARLTRLASV